MENYQICNECCFTLGLEINSIIISRCHRKFCDICGYSSDDDLSLIFKDVVDAKIKEYKEVCKKENSDKYL